MTKPAPTTKLCRKCHRRKPLTDFYLDRRAPGGRYHRCILCHTKVMKSRRRAPLPYSERFTGSQPGPKPKLDERQVMDILHRVLDLQELQKDVAREYGGCQRTVARITGDVSRRRVYKQFMEGRRLR